MAGRFFLKRHDFIAWLRNYDKKLYDEFCEAEYVGAPPVWLCYLWCNPEVGNRTVIPGYSDFLNSFQVPVADARIYFRTMIKCLLDHKSFSDVDQYSDDSNPINNSVRDDGVVKLSALIGVAASLEKPILYIGAGEFKPEQQLASQHVQLRCCDIAIPGTIVESLNSVIVKEDVVINDAYYEGMENDQRVKLLEAKTYYAKQYKVKNTDYTFYLPGLDEVRFTNDVRFAHQMEYMLSQFISTEASPTSNLLFWYNNNIPNIDKYLFLDVVHHDEMRNRIHNDISPVKTVEVPYYEIALCSTPDVPMLCDGIPYTATNAKAVLSTNGFSDGFLAYARRVLLLHKQITKLSASVRKLKKDLSRHHKRDPVATSAKIASHEQTIATLNTELVGLVKPEWHMSYSKLGTLLYLLPATDLTLGLVEEIVEESVFSPSITLLDRQYIWDNGADGGGANFAKEIKMIVGDGLLFDYKTGDGRFSGTLGCDVLQYDKQDLRVDRTRQFVSQLPNDFSDAVVLLRFVLHREKDIYAVLDLFSTAKIIIVVDFDFSLHWPIIDRFHERTWRNANKQRQDTNIRHKFRCKVKTVITPASLPTFTQLKRRGRFGSFLSYFVNDNDT